MAIDAARHYALAKPQNIKPEGPKPDDSESSAGEDRGFIQSAHQHASGFELKRRPGKARGPGSRTILMFDQFWQGCGLKFGSTSHC